MFIYILFYNVCAYYSYALMTPKLGLTRILFTRQILYRESIAQYKLLMNWWLRIYNYVITYTISSTLETYITHYIYYILVTYNSAMCITIIVL